MSKLVERSTQSKRSTVGMRSINLVGRYHVGLLLLIGRLNEQPNRIGEIGGIEVAMIALIAQRLK